MALDVAANINAKMNQQSVSTAISSLKTQFRNLGLDLKVNTPDLTKASTSFKLVSDSIDKTTDSMKKFGEQSGIAAKRLLAYTAVTTVFLGTLAVLRSAVEEAIKFQRELIRLSQTAGDTSSVIQGLEKRITSLARSYGVSSTELVKATIIFRQAGFTAKETADSVEVLAKALLAPNFDNGAQIAETIVALRSQFKEAVKDGESLEATMGGINAVAGAFAVEAKDLEEAIKRTGGAFAAAGGNVNELVSLFTSVRQTTRESAETIATAFRTIFARIQRADIIDQLRTFGIQLRITSEEANRLGDSKLEGNFVGAYEAIRRLSSAVKDLPTTDSRFAQIAEEIGGYRQISKVIPLLQQFAVAQEALNVAQGGAASLAINASQAQDAYTVKITKLKEQVFELGRTIVSSPGFAKLFDFFSSAASGAVKLAEAIGPLVPLITTLAAVKVGTGIFSLLQGFSGGFGSRTDTIGRTIRRANGGSVPGAGSGDTVPAMLTPGEYVLRKEAVKRIGVSTLDAMNSGKQRGYARGGVVQYFAGGGRIDKAVSDFDSGIDISKSAKNANVKVSDLIAKLVELGKITQDNTNALKESHRVIAEQTLARKTTQTVAPPATATDFAGLAPAIPSNRGSQFTTTSASLPSEVNPTGLLLATASSRRPLGFNNNTTISEPLPALSPTNASNRNSNFLKNTSVKSYISDDANLLPVQNVNSSRVKSRASYNYVPTVGTDSPNRIPNALYNDLDLLERQKEQARGLRRLPSAALGAGLIDRNSPTNKSNLSKIDSAALDAVNSSTKDSTLANFREKYIAGNGRGRRFSQEVFGENKEAFIGLDEGQQRELLDKKLKERRELNRQRREGRAELAARTGQGNDYTVSETGISPLTKPVGNGLLSNAGSAVSKIGRAGYNALGNPLLLGGAFLAADRLSQGGASDISAQTAVQSGGIQRFNNQEQVKSAASTAQIGAGIGAIFGPLGIAIGATAGALIGFSEGLKEAEKKIAQVKLDESITKLDNEITDLVAGKGGAGTGNINSLLAQVRTNSVDATTKSLQPSETDKFLAKATGGILGSKAPEAGELILAQRQNFRNQVGLQLPRLNQIGGRQASTSAKNFVNSGRSADATSIRVQSEEFANEFSSTNRELIQNIALIRQIPVKKVVEEFKKQFEDEAKALASAKRGKDARAESQNVLNSIGRLSQAFDTAAKAAEDSARANNILTDVFSGTSSVIQSRSLSAGISNLGVTGQASQDSFSQAFGVLDKIIGSDALRNTTNGLNQARQSLPDVLTSALRSNPSGGDGFIVRIREQLADVPKVIQDSIVSRLEGLDGSQLTDKLKESGEKLADELLSDFNPVKDALARIANDINSQSNAFTGGLNQAGRNNRVIEDSRSKADAISSERGRISAQFKASNILQGNRFADVAPTDFFTSQQALAPFTNQQSRLVAGTRAEGQGLNAQVIGAALQASKAEEQKLLSVRDQNPLDSQAAKNFADQQQQSDRLSQALKNLVDNSDNLRDAQERLSATTDRLNKIESSRQAGINLNEKVFNAQASFDFKQIRQLQLGQQGTNFLRSGGNIRNLGREQALATSSFLRENGNIAGARLRFDPKTKRYVREEGVTNDQLRQEQFGEGALAPSEQNREKSLKKERDVQQKRIDDEKSRQVEAANIYTGILTKANTDFVTSLNATFDKFKETVKEQKDALEKNILQNRQRGIETDIASLTAGPIKARDDLAKLGITNQNELDVVKANSGDLNNLSKLKKDFNNLSTEQQNIISGASQDITSVSTRLVKNDPNTQVMAKELLAGKRSISDTEFSPQLRKEVSSIVGRTTSDDNLVAQISERFEKNFIRLASQNPLENIDINHLFRTATQGVIAERQNPIREQYNTQEQRTGQNLRRGLGVQGANDLLRNPEKAQQVLDLSSKLGGSIEGVTKQFDSLKNSLKDITDSIVQKKAFGGSIFAPSGTDTVPAMLTPGEYVVNAASARNNLGLLQRINASKAPVYAATGGSIPSAGGSTGVPLEAASLSMKAAFDSFVSGTQNLVSSLNNFPREITGNFIHKVEVIHNGIEVFNNVDNRLTSVIMAKVEERFEKMTNSLRSIGING